MPHQGKWDVLRLVIPEVCHVAREWGLNFKALGLQGWAGTQIPWDHYVGLVDPSYVGVRLHMAPMLQESVLEDPEQAKDH